MKAVLPVLAIALVAAPALANDQRGASAPVSAYPSAPEPRPSRPQCQPRTAQCVPAQDYNGPVSGISWFQRASAPAFGPRALDARLQPSGRQ